MTKLDGGRVCGAVFLMCAVTAINVQAQAFTASISAPRSLAAKGKEYKFSGTRSGENPSSGLVADAAGNLYGAIGYAENSCANGYPCGAIFKITISENGGWTESIIYNFTETDGAYPSSGTLAIDAEGNLYGTVYGGQGAVYELSPNQNGTWSETILYSFQGGADGSEPSMGSCLTRQETFMARPRVVEAATLILIVVARPSN